MNARLWALVAAGGLCAFALGWFGVGGLLARIDSRASDKRYHFNAGVINGWLAIEEQRQGMINTNIQGLLDRAWEIYTNR